MPFGLVFGALVFGVLCGSLGLRWLVHPVLEVRIAGGLLGVLGIALGSGLFRGRRWARWGGVATGALLAVLGLRLVAADGGVTGHVFLFAPLAAAILLAVPATGDPTRHASPGSVEGASRVGVAGWVAAVCFLGLLGLGMVAAPDGSRPTPARAGALPSSAIGKSVRWTGFGEGLARARHEGKPLLATFVTDWCPYCTKMARQTWRASSVASRLDAVVPVRIDAEGTRGPDGHAGRELAARYGISGFPAQLLLDGEGRVLARYDGYQTPRQLLAWLDDALDAAPVASFTGTGS